MPQQTDAAPVVDERLVALLLSADTWEPVDCPDPSTATTDAERKKLADAAYLHKEVLPTLIPALHDLSALVQRDNELGEKAKPTSTSISRRHPTGDAGPVDWLAQYMLRNNTRHSSTLRNHPYGVLARAAEQQKQSTA